MTYDAFISYCSKDSKTHAKRLHKRLKSVGKLLNYSPNIFLDEANLQFGGNLSRSVERALESSAFLIVLVGPNTYESEWVDKEVRYFYRFHRNIDRIMIVRTSRSVNLSWDQSEDKFLQEDLLPQSLAEVFKEETKYVDYLRSNSLLFIPDYRVSLESRAQYELILASILRVDASESGVADNRYQTAKNYKKAGAIAVVLTLSLALISVGNYLQKSIKKEESKELAHRSRDALSVHDYPTAVEHILNAAEKDYSHQVKTQMLEIMREEIAQVASYHWERDLAGNMNVNVFFPQDGSLGSALIVASDGKHSEIVRYDFNEEERPENFTLPLAISDNVYYYDRRWAFVCSSEGMLKLDLINGVVSAEYNYPKDSAGHHSCEVHPFKGGVVAKTATPLGESEYIAIFSGRLDKPLPVGATNIIAAQKYPAFIFEDDETIYHVNPSSGAEQPQDTGIRKDKSTMSVYFSPEGALHVVTDKTIKVKDFGDCYHGRNDLCHRNNYEKTIFDSNIVTYSVGENGVAVLSDGRVLVDGVEVALFPEDPTNAQIRTLSNGGIVIGGNGSIFTLFRGDPMHDSRWYINRLGSGSIESSVKEDNSCLVKNSLRLSPSLWVVGEADELSLKEDNHLDQKCSHVSREVELNINGVAYPRTSYAIESAGSGLNSVGYVVKGSDKSVHFMAPLADLREIREISNAITSTLTVASNGQALINSDGEITVNGKTVGDPLSPEQISNMVGFLSDGRVLSEDGPQSGVFEEQGGDECVIKRITPARIRDEFFLDLPVVEKFCQGQVGLLNSEVDGVLDYTSFGNQGVALIKRGDELALMTRTGFMPRVGESRVYLSKKGVYRFSISDDLSYLFQISEDGSVVAHPLRLPRIGLESYWSPGEIVDHSVFFNKEKEPIKAVQSSPDGHYFFALWDDSEDERTSHVGMYDSSSGKLLYDHKISRHSIEMNDLDITVIQDGADYSIFPRTSAGLSPKESFIVHFTMSRHDLSQALCGQIYVPKCGSLEGFIQ